jgi:3-methyladenine DNA glycosylase AlkC
MRADNSRFLVQAARRRSHATRERAIQALRRLAAKGDPVTFETVARTAGVSRSWLYAQSDLRLEIGRLRALQQEGQARAASSPLVPARQRASEASLRRRLEAVNAEIRRLREENRQLREQLAWAIGERRAASIHSSREDRSATIGPCS